jgi:hypothetical protein
MRNFIRAFFLISIIAPTVKAETLNEIQKSLIIKCLNSKSDETGSPLPTDGHGGTRFRYHFGKFLFHYPSGEPAEVGRDDEVRIGAYSQDEKSVVIYDVFVSGPPKTPVVEVSTPSTFHRRLGKWMGGDNPGGVAMNLYLVNLLDAFSKQKPDVISIKTGDELFPANCTVLHP